LPASKLGLTHDSIIFGDKFISLKHRHSGMFLAGMTVFKGYKFKAVLFFRQQGGRIGVW
jgi:hypothetical protein